MKMKTKLLPCVGAIVWLTTAILPSSAMAESTGNYTDDAQSFIKVSPEERQEAVAWCKMGLDKGAACCSADRSDLGHPGYFYTHIPGCVLYGNHNLEGYDMTKAASKEYR